MTDWFILPILAIFGIIGYGLTGMIGRSIDRHTADDNKPGPETRTDEYAETGKPGRAYSCVPFFLHLQRKGHTRGV